MGSRGDKIPRMARIIAVADTFDAMTTERPYQKAMSFEAALARLNELKGSGFDEHIVRIVQPRLPRRRGSRRVRKRRATGPAPTACDRLS